VRAGCGRDRQELKAVTRRLGRSYTEVLIGPFPQDQGGVSQTGHVYHTCAESIFRRALPAQELRRGDLTQVGENSDLKTCIAVVANGELDGLGRPF